MKAVNSSTIILLNLVLLTSSVGAEDFVWWEGEAPAKTNLNNGGFPASQYPKTRDGLSGGDWLANNAKQGDDPLFATYEIDVPADANYSFWCRKFWQHGPFRWRFDQQEWQQCAHNVALADTYELAKFICANWVNLGKVELKKGKHTFELQLTDVEKGKEGTACFDCFILSAKPFVPAGKSKPGEKSSKHEEGYFAFEPDLDSFRKDALLDLRYLNEPAAGEKGWVTAKGNDFVLGGGKPVRFWAVNWVRDTTSQSREEIDYLAAKLAKSGVNLVRFHQNIFNPSQPDALAIDRKYLDELHYCIAALKKQGIYTDISWYYVLGYGSKDKTAHGLPGYEKLKGDHHPPFALMFFEPRLQEMWRAWAKAMLETPNPYTGLPIAKDPAVALVEINNEDNLLFHTFSPETIPQPYFAKLEKRFGEFLSKKYGSLDKAFAQFPNQKCPRDNAADGIAELMPAWNMTSDGALKFGDDKKKRMQNQVEFLANVQRDWFKEGREYLKKTLGYGGLVIATGWCTADDRLLDGIERWTYQSCDVIDRHGYFGDGNVAVGSTFHMKSALLAPNHSPIPFVQEQGFPHTITEINWFKPNPRTAEMAFLCSTYGSLQGMDAYYFFCVGSSYWNKITSNIPVMVPSLICQPAYALQYRRGDVKEAPAVVHQVLPLEGQFALEGCTKFGENADQAARPDAAAQAGGALDPMTPFVGKITRTITPSAAIKTDDKPKADDISSCIDRARKTVRSMTGECALDWGNGIGSVDTPKSQGVCGFLNKKPKHELSEVAIESRNEYGTVHVISLDDQPLKTSKKILVQAFTEEQAYGWRYEVSKPSDNVNARELKVANMGIPPLNIREIEATVTFKTPFTKATPLDENGYALKPLDAKGTTLVLPKNALFVLIER